MASSSPVIPYTSREFLQVLQDLTAFVQATNSGLNSDFTQSAAGTLLLQLAAGVVDTVSFGQDLAAAEVFLSTCRTYDAAVRFAKSVGYVPRGATSASAAMVCDPLPPAVTAVGANVAAGQIITIGAVQYKLTADVAIPAGAVVASFTLVQAQDFTETFPAENVQFQRVTVSNGIVAQGSWHIFVGDPTNPANEWAQVDELLLLPSASNSYQISLDSAGRLSVLFGNGSSGAIPTQTVTIQYQTTNGLAGNLPVFAISGALTADLTTSGTSSLAVVNSTGAATGGLDRESLAELKRNIPAYIRTNGRVVTIGDYEDFLSQQSDVALVFADISVASYEANIARLNVWGTQNVVFTGESARSTRRSQTPYIQYTQISPEKAAALHSALAPKTMLTVYNRVLRPAIANVDLYVGDVKYDVRYDPAQIHQAITNAVVGVFENSTGFVVRVSDLTEAIDSVPGVTRFNIVRAVFDYQQGGFPTGSITFSGNPADGDTVSVNDGQMGYAFEFDSNNSTVSGRVRVVVGNSPEATATNLINAINQKLAIFAYRNPTLGGPTVSLVHTREGDSFNLPLVSGSSVLAVSGLSGGTFNRTNLREDRRINQTPIPDPYPVGTYTAGNPDGTGWVTGGVTPYRPLFDFDLKAVRSARNFYDEQFLFNNEIRYDAGVELTPLIQAINLRRLVFDLVPDTRVNL